VLELAKLTIENDNCVGQDGRCLWWMNSA